MRKLARTAWIIFLAAWPAPQRLASSSSTTPGLASTAPASLSSTPWVEFLPAQGEPGDAPSSAAELQVVRSAAEIANTVKNSLCFRAFLARRTMIDTKGRSSQEVAAHLQALRGRVLVAFYYRCDKLATQCPEPTRAVAYRQPPQGKIFINRAHFDAGSGHLDVYELAGTLAHEGFGHLLGGYDHSFGWTATRDFSVPYSISGADPSNDDAFRHCRKALGF